MQDQTRRIVVLDDDPLVAQTIQLMVEDQGIGACRSLHAPDGFFAAVEQWEPTHAILDLAMPGMDGVQILEALVHRAPQIRIVLLSGLGQRVIDSAHIYAREHGLRVDGALEKPVSPAQLRQVLCRQPADADTQTQSTAVPQPSDITVAAIREALDRGEIEPFYQPRIDCATRLLTGFEVLARWRRPGQGIVLPDRFLDRMQSGGLMDQLTESIADQALRWFATHSGFDFGYGLRLSLNISHDSLRSGALLEHLAAQTHALRLDPRRVVLEVPESAVITDPTEAVGLFTRVRSQGFELAIDDFGSGDSSLQQLVRLPFSELKVDGAIVRNAPHARDGELLLTTILDLAANLQMRAMAKGVEDADTFELLAGMGCGGAQGFFFSEALPADEVEDWVARWEGCQASGWVPPELRYG